MILKPVLVPLKGSLTML